MRQSVLVLVFILAASLVQAEVLSWQVDIDGGAGNTSYVTAQLFATTTTGAGYELTGTSFGGQINKNDDTTGVWTRDQNVSNIYSTYSFFVKLFQADGTTLAGWSGLQTWDQLVSSGALVAGTTPTFPATTPWNAGTSVVPEPTSVGLLALGMSALLLRRRRRV